MNQNPETPSPSPDLGLKDTSSGATLNGQNEHFLKCWPQFFNALLDGSKTFEVRKNDRNFAVGDTLELHEFIPSACDAGFTGRSLSRKVTYILEGSGTVGTQFGLQGGYVVMGLAPSVGAATDSEKVLEEKEAVTRNTVPGQMGPYDELVAEVETLRAKLNAPELLSFRDGAVLEAAHQRDRWGSDHDAGKEPQDWFWLVGYLSGKALRSHIEGDTEKALHHTISSAAALANWHASILGANNVMRPGISAAKQKAASSNPDGNENYLAAPIPQKCL